MCRSGGLVGLGTEFLLIGKAPGEHFSVDELVGVGGHPYQSH